MESQKLNKCPYRDSKCHEIYNHRLCLGDYKKCWEHGRLKFLEEYKDFEDTDLMLGALEDKTQEDQEC